MMTKKDEIANADETMRRMTRERKSPVSVKGQQTKVHNLVRSYWQQVWNARFAIEADKRKTIYSVAEEFGVDALDVERILVIPEPPQWVQMPEAHKE